MTQIPDNCPAPDELLKKLQSVVGNLPKGRFDATCTGELSFLIAKIASQSEGLTSEHLMHASLGMLRKIQLAVFTRLNIATEKDETSSDMTPTLALMLALEHINKSLQSAHEAAYVFKKYFNVEFASDVSDSFLESINVSREQYDEFKKSHGAIH